MKCCSFITSLKGMGAKLTGKSDSSKIQPLDSDLKYNHAHDTSSRGSVGTDNIIEKSRIDPMSSGGISAIVSIKGTTPDVCR